MEASQEDITRLLTEWGKGDRGALDRLIPIVYRELHKMAKHYLAGQSPDHTLQTTAVIHEAYLKLAGEAEKHLENRAHFFAVAAKAMRHLLVDHARQNRAARRGGGLRIVPIAEEFEIGGGPNEQLIRLDDALNALAKLHARQSDVVELRYFAGLSVEETASVLNIAPETVMRDWKVARAFLYREMARSDAQPVDPGNAKP